MRRTHTVDVPVTSWREADARAATVAEFARTGRAVLAIELADIEPERPWQTTAIRTHNPARRDLYPLSTFILRTTYERLDQS